MNRVVRHIVEEDETQVARRPKLRKDGSVDVYVTRRFARILAYIAEMKAVDDQPSYDDIAKNCGYSSYKPAAYAVKQLADMGLLTTAKRRARSIKLTREGMKVYEDWRECEEKKRKRMVAK